MRTLPFLLLLFPSSLIAAPEADSGNGNRMTISEYIDKYKNDAIKDMMLTGVPASITLAQGILESEAGNSDLARVANNHFGIKCHNDWSGRTYHKDDDEKDECFRKYNSVIESFDDHSRFLRERQRYAFLFEYDITDYKSWAHGLKKAGYATNPKYADLLIRLIEEHNLNQYDKGGRMVPLNQPISRSAPEIKQHSNRNQNQSKSYKVNSNDIPYIIAKEGDTFYSIAAGNELFLWQVLKYNDAGSNDILAVGEIVYLKPKRGKPVEKSHLVSTGDSMRSIAQQYGVKLKRLYKLNHMKPGESPAAGDQIRLR